MNFLNNFLTAIFKRKLFGFFFVISCLKIQSTQIVIAGLGLPWLGYTFGWISAKLFKQPSPDAIAIAVETGIQNTGIAIFLLTFSLDQPMADLTTVIPVAVAIMTPFPLLAIYLVQKCMKM